MVNISIIYFNLLSIVAKKKKIVKRVLLFFAVDFAELYKCY